MSEYLPPHSIEAEQAVLGCVLSSSKDCMGDCVEHFKAGAEVFFDLRHKTIYGAMLALYGEKKEFDSLAIYQRLKDEKQLEDAGGFAYVSELPDVGGALLVSYIGTVKEKFILRKILEVCFNTAVRVRDYEGDAVKLLDEVERMFLDITHQRHLTRELSSTEFIQPAIERIENYHRGGAQMLGISYGYDYLDKMTCGAVAGQLIVIAARPGLGKTSLALNIMERVAILKKIPVGMFSLEMTAGELGARIMFQVAKADYQRFRTGYFEGDDLPRVTAASARIGTAPIWIDETSGLNVLELRSKARRMVQRYGIKLFVVDYLQLMHASRFYNNREQEVAEISTGLKDLAKELQVPVIVLAQFNRDIEREPNRKPRLSDLRESGRIEADADLVGMLYEPKLEDEEKANLMAHDADWAKKMKRVNLLIAKQRNGPTGDVELEFHKSAMRVESHIRPKPTKEQIIASLRKLKDQLIARLKAVAKELAELTGEETHEHTDTNDD